MIEKSGCLLRFLTLPGLPRILGTGVRNDIVLVISKKQSD